MEPYLSRLYSTPRAYVVYVSVLLATLSFSVGWIMVKLLLGSSLGMGLLVIVGAMAGVPMATVWKYGYSFRHALLAGWGACIAAFGFVLVPVPLGVVLIAAGLAIVMWVVGKNL